MKILHMHVKLSPFLYHMLQCVFVWSSVAFMLSTQHVQCEFLHDLSIHLCICILTIWFVQLDLFCFLVCMIYITLSWRHWFPWKTGFLQPNRITICEVTQISFGPILTVYSLTDFFFLVKIYIKWNVCYRTLYNIVIRNNSCRNS